MTDSALGTIHSSNRKVKVDCEVLRILKPLYLVHPQEADTQQ